MTTNLFMQDPKHNRYLIVETGTKLLMSVSSYEFEQKKSSALTWFTACNNFDMDMDVCEHCDLCLAGVMNHRLYFDEENQIIMHLPKGKQSPRHYKIKMQLFNQEQVPPGVLWFNTTHDVSGIHYQSQIVRKAYLRCFKGNFILEYESLHLANEATAFHVV